MFSWNGRRKFIDADNLEEALDEFMRRFGFYAPNTDGMEIFVAEFGGDFYPVNPW